mgnify:CR=1 FL=1
MPRPFFEWTLEHDELIEMLIAEHATTREIMLVLGAPYHAVRNRLLTVHAEAWAEHREWTRKQQGRWLTMRNTRPARARERTVEALLRENPRLTHREIAERIGITEAGVRFLLQRNPELRRMRISPRNRYLRASIRNLMRDCAELPSTKAMLSMPVSRDAIRQCRECGAAFHETPDPAGIVCERCDEEP